MHSLHSKQHCVCLVCNPTSDAMQSQCVYWNHKSANCCSLKWPWTLLFERWELWINHTTDRENRKYRGYSGDEEWCQGGVIFDTLKSPSFIAVPSMLLAGERTGTDAHASMHAHTHTAICYFNSQQQLRMLWATLSFDDKKVWSHF